MHWFIVAGGFVAGVLAVNVVVFLLIVLARRRQGAELRKEASVGEGEERPVMLVGQFMIFGCTCGRAFALNMKANTRYECECGQVWLGTHHAEEGKLEVGLEDSGPVVQIGPEGLA